MSAVRRLSVVTIASFLMMSIPVHQAKADGSWWDVFFPSNRNIPAETLQAPFADVDAVVMEPEEGGSVLALDVAHIPRAEMMEWVERKVSDLIIYNAKTYEDDYRNKSVDIDEAGKAEYIKFLQDTNMLKSLSSKAYDIKGYAKDVPTILTEGALNGRYRWLLQIPVMLSFVKTGVNDYKQVSDAEIVTTEYMISLQIGRSEKATNPQGLVIETWKAVPLEKEK
jgi:hypothetical protein